MTLRTNTTPTRRGRRSGAAQDGGANQPLTSALYGGPYRARTDDIHGVNVALPPFAGNS